MLIKIYAGLWPVEAGLAARLNRICEGALPSGEARAETEADLWRLGFEGVYFPTDELLAEIGAALTPQMRGRLDELDLENWKLVRHEFADGKIGTKSAPLNNVLDYSGH